MIFAVLGVLVVAIFIALLAVREQTRCPQCKKFGLQRTSSRVISRQHGVKTEEVTYTCRYFGKTVIKTQQSSDEHYRGGGRGGGPLIGGDLGGFGGGGGGGGCGDVGGGGGWGCRRRG